MPNIHPAHNDPTEQPIPYREIRESFCINCKRECKIDDLITYTRLHNKTIIWWHRRKNQDDSDPCPEQEHIEIKQTCKHCGKELEKKRVHINGKGFTCAECVKVQQKEYRKKVLASGNTKKIYYLKNREKIKKQQRQYRLTLREQRPKPTTEVSNIIMVEHQQLH